MGRFDVTTCAVGYFADSPLTTLYETLCRRETAHRTLADVGERHVLRDTLRAPLRLLDLCGAEEASPVLVSTRYAETQALAFTAHVKGLMAFDTRHHNIPVINASLFLSRR